MKTLQSFFVLASVFLFIVLLPNLSFAQTTQGGSADPGDDWTPTHKLVAIPPHAPFAQQKAFVGYDKRKYYPVLMFEQMDSSVTGDGASYLNYFYTKLDLNTLNPVPAKVVLDACVEDIVENPNIQVRLSVYFANSKTGEWVQSGTQVISNDWVKYTFDLTWATPAQYNIFSIMIVMGPSNQRMYSKVGLYTINFFDSLKNLTWNYNLITDVPHETLVPVEFRLEQNYPNPFNPQTVISYQCPATSVVTLKVYDLLGREVATLVNEEKAPGNYEVKFDGSNLASGMYIYRMQADNFVSVKKMLLMK